MDNSYGDIEEVEFNKNKKMDVIKSIRVESMKACSEGIESLKSALEKLAENYANQKGRSRSDFDDSSFLDLCFQLGIDPTTTHLSIFEKLFGGLGGADDFYKTLSVLIIDICVQTREINQGVIEMNDLLTRVNNRRVKDNVKMKDIRIAIQKCQKIAPYFEMKSVEGTELLVTTPTAFDKNELNILKIAQDHGGVVPQSLLQKFSIKTDDTYFTQLIRKGFIWIDHLGPELTYYFPSFYFKE